MNVFNLVKKNAGEDLDSDDFRQMQIEFKYSNMVLYGQTDNFDCDKDFLASPPEYETYLYELQFSGKKHPTSFSTAYTGASGSPKFPKFDPMFKVMLFPSVRERAVYENTQFINVGGTDYVCDPKRPSYVFGSIHDNHNLGDTTPIFTRTITKTNVDMEYLTHYMKPLEFRVTTMKCIDLDCNGFTQFLISDFDGSLVSSDDNTDTRGAILANPEYIFDVQNVRQNLNYDRVPKIAKMDANGNELDLSTIIPNVGRPKNSACQFQSKANAHVCTGDDAWTYNFVTLVNHDFDVSHRRLGPLSIVTNRGVDGNVDILNSPARDDGSLWGLSTGYYKATVAMGTTAEFYFSATPPQDMTIQMEGAGFETRWSSGHHHKKLLFKLYNPIPQALKLAKLPVDQTLPLVPEEMEPLSQKPTLDDDPGSYFHDRDEQMLYVVLADNNEVYKMTVSDQIAMSFGIPPVPLEDFFGDKLVENIANFFGIPADQIRVVAVVSENSRRRRDTSSGGMVESIDIEITINEDDAAQVESVHTKNEEMSSGLQSGDKSAVNGLVSGVTTNPIEVTEVAVVTTPKTQAAIEAFAARTDEIMKTEGVVTRAAILKTAVIVEIDSMAASTESTTLSVDCKNGGQVPIGDISVSFYDVDGNLANAGTSSKQWTVELAVPNDNSDGYFTGDLSATVINTGATLSDITFDCDVFRHAVSTETMALSVSVTDPVDTGFTANIALNIEPLTIISTEISEFAVDQEIDCSIGGQMSLYDLDVFFYDNNSDEVLVGTDSDTWTGALTFSSNDGDFTGNTHLSITQEEVSFDDLSVNCDSFKDLNQMTSVIITATMTATSGLELTAEATVHLKPSKIDLSTSNWNNKLQMINDDGSIRLLNDQRLCVQADSLLFGVGRNKFFKKVFFSKILTFAHALFSHSSTAVDQSSSQSANLT